jgi:hypothetical protein
METARVRAFVLIVAPLLCAPIMTGIALVHSGTLCR